MHNAPSVSYPVGRCVFQRQLYIGFLFLTLVVLLVWALHQGFNWTWGMAATAVLWGAYGGAGAHVGTLTWDGQAWCLQGYADASDAQGEVNVVLDVQKALLLRWQPTSDTLTTKSLWLWLGSEASTEHWQDLRRAVYQRLDRQ